MAVKANLRLVLYAGKAEIAESEDNRLWQRVLAAIQKGTTGDDQDSEEDDALLQDNEDNEDSNAVKKLVKKFADELGIPTEVLIGACDPESEKPYLRLDEHCWEFFRNNVPRRGPGAIAPIVISATLLCLWFKYAGLDKPEKNDALAVLKVIGVEDHRPDRGIKNCPWLQLRADGKIFLNPSQISKAKDIAKAFCLKEPILKEKKK